MSLKEVFDKSKPGYEKSLNNNDFYENLRYHQDNGNKNQHKNMMKRERKIIRFHPPFFKNCENKYWQEVLQNNQPSLPETP